MELELLIDGGKFPIQVQMTVDCDGKVIYQAEYMGTTISTFPTHKEHKGASLDESIGMIAKDLRKAIQELLDQ